MKGIKSIISITGLLILLMASKGWAESFLALPLQNTVKITCDFCCYKFRNGSCHGGIDYGVQNNTEITAAAAGTVEKIVSHYPDSPNRRAGYGNHIFIRHPNGYRTIYAHLAKDAIYVNEGESVRGGQIMGLSDNSGYSTGPHLHFEIRDPDGRKVDPYGDNPDYPNCGANALWVTCPPQPRNALDEDGDGFTGDDGDCDDDNPDIYPGAQELCNSQDDDCDDQTDEDWPLLGTACTVRPTPSCEREGSWICEPGERGIVCDADYEVRDELCNGFDDDCDGETDEEWKVGLASDLGMPCSVGWGICRREGFFICTPDGLATVCSADPGTSSDEVCDGLDNDCNEYIDDFCYCDITRPYWNCICRRCDDASCPSDKHCLVIDLTPAGEAVYGCYVRFGCYFCPGPGVEGWQCSRTLSCTEYVESEYCLHPDAFFCGDYCPFPW